MPTELLRISITTLTWYQMLAVFARFAGHGPEAACHLHEMFFLQASAFDWIGVVVRSSPCLFSLDLIACS